MNMVVGPGAIPSPKNDKVPQIDKAQQNDISRFTSDMTIDDNEMVTIDQNTNFPASNSSIIMDS